MVSVFAIHYDQSAGDKFPTPGGDPVDRPLKMFAQFPVIAGAEFADSDKHHLPAVVFPLLVAVKSRFAAYEVVTHNVAFWSTAINLSIVVSAWYDPFPSFSFTLLSSQVISDKAHSIASSISGTASGLIPLW